MHKTSARIQTFKSSQLYVRICKPYKVSAVSFVFSLPPAAGSQYWVFRDNMAKEGYPRPLSDWGMRMSDGRLVDKVEAAFVWAHNGKTYLFSGGEFWRFDESQKSNQEIKQPEPGYPRKASLWKGVPARPDDIISWKEGDAYFFKDNVYWVLERGGLDQENLTPKPIGEHWLRCPAVAPPSAPANPHPKDCSCALNGSSALPRSSWLLLLLLTLAVERLVRK